MKRWKSLIELFAPAAALTGAYILNEEFYGPQLAVVEQALATSADADLGPAPFTGRLPAETPDSQRRSGAALSCSPMETGL